MQELWQPVVGFEDLYEVSSLGQVRTIKTGRVRVPFLHKGYWQLNLSRQNKVYGQRIHMLVAKAFLSPCPGQIGIQRGQWTVDHIDNDKHNNAASNLQWLQCDDNFRKDNLGSNHPAAKLTHDIVASIRLDNRTQHEIASQYGVSQTTISEIKSGKTWNAAA